MKEFEVGDLLNMTQTRSASDRLLLVYDFPGLAYYTMWIDTRQFMLLNVADAWAYTAVAKGLPRVFWHELDVIGNHWGEVCQILWRGRLFYIVRWLEGREKGRKQTVPALRLNTPLWNRVRRGTRDKEL